MTREEVKAAYENWKAGKAINTVVYNAIADAVFICEDHHNEEQIIDWVLILLTDELEQ